MAELVTSGIPTNSPKILYVSCSPGSNVAVAVEVKRATITGGAKVAIYAKKRNLASLVPGNS